MALWKEPVKSPSSSLPNPPDIARFDTPDPVETPVPARVPAKAAEPAPVTRSASESLIAPDLVIEGKIEGAGHVRIAGRFKGDINVRGDHVPPVEASGLQQNPRAEVVHRLPDEAVASQLVQHLPHGRFADTALAGKVRRRS